MKRRDREPGENVPAKPTTLGAYSAKGGGDPAIAGNREPSESDLFDVHFEAWIAAGVAKLSARLSEEE